MTALAPINSKVGGVAIDYNAVLNTLKLNPKDPNVQALVLVCQEYELDPVLKHMVLIQGAPYITHKGLWHMAHRSGLLDGEDIVASGETDKEWWATVSIYRKDWSRPITMTGRYPKSAQNKAHGPEMAVTRGECLVLRRMFDVAVPVQEEINWEQQDRAGRGRPIGDDGQGAPSPTQSRPAQLPVATAPATVSATTGSELVGPFAEPVAQPVEVTSSSPRSFAPPKTTTMREAQADVAAVNKAHAPDEAAKLVDGDGVSAELMRAIRADLAALTVQTLRDELRDQFEAAGLPNIKAEGIVLDDDEYAVALDLILKKLEKQAELEQPFEEPSLLKEGAGS